MIDILIKISFQGVVFWKFFRILFKVVVFVLLSLITDNTKSFGFPRLRSGPLSGRVIRFEVSFGNTVAEVLPSAPVLIFFLGMSVAGAFSKADFMEYPWESSRGQESPACSGISSPGRFLFWGFVEAISPAVEVDP